MGGSLEGVSRDDDGSNALATDGSVTRLYKHLR